MELEKQGLIHAHLASRHIAMPRLVHQLKHQRTRDHRSARSRFGPTAVGPGWREGAKPRTLRLGSQTQLRRCSVSESAPLQPRSLQPRQSGGRPDSKLLSPPLALAASCRLSWLTVRMQQLRTKPQNQEPQRRGGEVAVVVTTGHRQALKEPAASRYQLEIAGMDHWVACRWLWQRRVAAPGDGAAPVHPRAKLGDTNL